MDLRLLQAFRATMENRSFTRAASTLGVSQPAVSTQIARLEDMLGFALFHRVSGRIRPTAEALLFHAEAARALSHVDRLTDAADEIRAGRSGYLTLVSHPWAVLALLPKVIADFRHERPSVHIRVITRSSEDIRGVVAPDAIDIGISEPPIEASLARVHRFAMTCEVIMPADDPLAERPALGPDELSERAFIALYNEHMTFQRTALAFAEAGARWQVATQVQFFASAAEMVAAGVGLAIVDPLTARTYRDRGLVSRRFDPPIRYEIELFRTRDRKPSTIAAVFEQKLLDHVAGLGITAS